MNIFFSLGSRSEARDGGGVEGSCVERDGMHVHAIHLSVHGQHVSAINK